MPLEFAPPACLIVAPSGAGKTTWLTKTKMAFDGDLVIAALWGWPQVRIRRFVNLRFTGDIDPGTRVRMSDALHTMSRSMAVPIAFNGYIVFQPNAYYAFVQPPADRIVRQLMARDHLTKQAAVRKVDLNLRANLDLYNHAPVERRLLANDFDKASFWLDAKFLESKHAHCASLVAQQARENPRQPITALTDPVRRTKK